RPAPSRSARCSRATTWSVASSASKTAPPGASCAPSEKLRVKTLVDGLSAAAARRPCACDDDGGADVPPHFSVDAFEYPPAHGFRSALIGTVPWFRRPPPPKPGPPPPPRNDRMNWLLSSIGSSSELRQKSIQMPSM